MSNTTRKTPIHRPCRKPSCRLNLTNAQQVIEELDEAGLPVPNRIRNYKSRIATTYDDLPVSSYSQLKYLYR